MIWRNFEQPKDVANKAREYTESIWPSFCGQPMAWHTFSDGSRCTYVAWAIAYQFERDSSINLDEVIRKIIHKWNSDMERIAKKIPSHEAIVWREYPILSSSVDTDGGTNKSPLVLKGPEAAALLEELKKELPEIKLYARFGFRNYDISLIDGLATKEHGGSVKLLNE